MEAYEQELNDEDTLSMHRGGRRDKSIKFKEEGVGSSDRLCLCLGKRCFRVSRFQREKW